MLGSNFKKYSINAFCSFKDRTMEDEFFRSYIEKSIKYMRPIALLLGTVYLLFIIPDFFVVKDALSVRKIFINRVFFFLLVLILYVMMNKIKNYKFLSYLVTTCEFLAIISFLLVMYMYGNPNYLVQAFGVIVIILGLFLIPNKWINMVIVSIAASIAFLIMTNHFVKGIEISHYTAGAVYIFIVIILSGISSFINNYLKRKEYIDSKELKRLSETDSLTNIWNRSKFDMELKYWVDYSRLNNIPLSLAIFDIDDFKKVNDAYGHLVGDEIIIETVEAVKSVIRSTDVFARWGGEEFVILLPETDKHKAVELLEKARLQILGQVHQKAGSITCSLGLATQVKNHQAAALLKEADEMLYLAKSTGKNKVVG